MSRPRELVRAEVGALVTETRGRAALVAKTTGLLWVIELVDKLLLGSSLDWLGIHPRSLGGLLGIVFAPFLHAGIGHMLANTLPLLVLGFLVTTRKRMDFYVVAAASALASGLGVWLFAGANTVTVGASGVIFGFLGFLMGRGFFERKPSAILLSLVVTFLFGGMLWGVLPIVAAGISWQAHLFGFLGGLLTSRLLGQELRKRQKPDRGL